jgi:hypothetical protein
LYGYFTDTYEAAYCDDLQNCTTAKPSDPETHYDLLPRADGIAIGTAGGKYPYSYKVDYTLSRTCLEAPVCPLFRTAGTENMVTQSKGDCCESRCNGDNDTGFLDTLSCLQAWRAKDGRYGQQCSTEMLQAKLGASGLNRTLASCNKINGSVHCTTCATNSDIFMGTGWSMMPRYRDLAHISTWTPSREIYNSSKQCLQSPIVFEALSFTSLSLWKGSFGTGTGFVGRALGNQLASLVKGSHFPQGSNAPPYKSWKYSPLATARITDQKYPDSYGEKVAAQRAVDASNQQHMAQLLNAFNSSGMDLVLTGWTPGKVENNKFKEVNASASTDADTYMPFMHFTMQHGDCRATMSVGMVAIVNPATILGGHVRLGMGSWWRNGTCTNSNPNNEESGTTQTKKWARTASERLEDINIILNQCGSFDGTFCYGKPPVKVAVLSNLTTTSETCAAWFTGVDNALRARVNTVRTLMVDAHQLACTMVTKAKESLEKCKGEELKEVTRIQEKKEAALKESLDSSSLDKVDSEMKEEMSGREDVNEEVSLKEGEGGNKRICVHLRTDVAKQQQVGGVVQALYSPDDKVRADALLKALVGPDGTCIAMGAYMHFMETNFMKKSPQEQGALLLSPSSDACSHTARAFIFTVQSVLNVYLFENPVENRTKTMQCTTTVGESFCGHLVDPFCTGSALGQSNFMLLIGYTQALTKGEDTKANMLVEALAPVMLPLHKCTQQCEGNEPPPLEQPDTSTCGSFNNTDFSPEALYSAFLCKGVAKYDFANLEFRKASLGTAPNAADLLNITRAQKLPAPVRHTKSMIGNKTTAFSYNITLTGKMPLHDFEVPASGDDSLCKRGFWPRLPGLVSWASSETCNMIVVYTFNLCQSDGTTLFPVQTIAESRLLTSNGPCRRWFMRADTAIRTVLAQKRQGFTRRYCELHTAQGVKRPQLGEAFAFHKQSKSWRCKSTTSSFTQAWQTKCPESSQTPQLDHVSTPWGASRGYLWNPETAQWVCASRRGTC